MTSSLIIVTYMYIYVCVQQYNLLNPFSVARMYVYVFGANHSGSDSLSGDLFVPGEDWFSLSQQSLMAGSSSSRSGAL